MEADAYGHNLHILQGLVKQCGHGRARTLDCVNKGLKAEEDRLIPSESTFGPGRRSPSLHVCPYAR
jgi:hypothetical protein